MTVMTSYFNAQFPIIKHHNNIGTIAMMAHDPRVPLHRAGLHDWLASASMRQRNVWFDRAHIIIVPHLSVTSSPQTCLVPRPIIHTDYYARMNRVHMAYNLAHLLLTAQHFLKCFVVSHAEPHLRKLGPLEHKHILRKTNSQLTHAGIVEQWMRAITHDLRTWLKLPMRYLKYTLHTMWTSLVISF